MEAHGDARRIGPLVAIVGSGGQPRIMTMCGGQKKAKAGREGGVHGLDWRVPVVCCSMRAAPPASNFAISRSLSPVVTVVIGAFPMRGNRDLQARLILPGEVGWLASRRLPHSRCWAWSILDVENCVRCYGNPLQARHLAREYFTHDAFVLPPPLSLARSWSVSQNTSWSSALHSDPQDSATESSNT